MKYRLSIIPVLHMTTQAKRMCPKSHWKSVQEWRKDPDLMSLIVHTQLWDHKFKSGVRIGKKEAVHLLIGHLTQSRWLQLVEKRFSLSRKVLRFFFKSWIGTRKQAFNFLVLRIETNNFCIIKAIYYELDVWFWSFIQNTIWNGKLKLSGPHFL